jgi:hypothetical protein
LTERAHKSPKILCAGIAVQDIVMRVESFPAPGTKVPASEFIITGGGCAANAAVTIARLNGRVAFAGPLGGTEIGRLRALLIVNADHGDEVRRRFADDPWVRTDRLAITSIEPWNLIVGAERLSALANSA